MYKLLVFQLLLSSCLSLLSSNNFVSPRSRTVKISAYKDDKTYDVVVVGSGIGGLISAAKLAKKGLKTLIIEKNSHLGGRCGSELWNNSFSESFRFDIGPSLLLSPDIYKRTFQQLGESLDAYVDVLPVDPFYRCFFEEDNSTIDITSNPDLMRKQIEEIEENSWPNFQVYMAAAKGFLDYGLPVFIEEKIQIKGLFSFLKACLQCLPIFPHRYMLDNLFQSNKIKAALSFQDLYVGLSPYEAPAVFSLLQALEFDRKIYYPKKGFESITMGLASIVKECPNLDVLKSTVVQEVKVENGGNTDKPSVNVLKIARDNRKNGITMKRPQSDEFFNTAEVEVISDLIRTKCVILNVDAPYAESTIIPKKYSEERTIRSRPSCGIISLNFAFSKELKPLSHHSIFLSKYYKQSWKVVENTFDTKPKVFFDENAFNFYVHAPSRTDPTTCPAGRDSITVLVPVAPLPLKDRKTECQNYDIPLIRNSVIRRLEEGLKAYSPEETWDLESLIIHEHVRDPLQWESEFGLFRGSAFGLSHPLNQLALLRPDPRHSKIRGLYRVGASTRPGNGVPLVMVSADIVCKTVLKDLGAQ